MIDRQTDKLTDRQTNRQTDRQTDSGTFPGRETLSVLSEVERSSGRSGPWMIPPWESILSRRQEGAGRSACGKASGSGLPLGGAESSTALVPGKEGQMKHVEARSARFIPLHPPFIPFHPPFSPGRNVKRASFPGLWSLRSLCHSGHSGHSGHTSDQALCHLGVKNQLSADLCLHCGRACRALHRFRPACVCLCVCAFR